MAAEMLQIPWGRIPIHLQHKEGKQSYQASEDRKVTEISVIMKYKMLPKW